MEPTKIVNASGTSTSKKEERGGKVLWEPSESGTGRTGLPGRSWATEERDLTAVGRLRRRRHKIFQPRSIPASCLLLPLAKPNQQSWPVRGSVSWSTDKGEGMEAGTGDCGGHLANNQHWVKGEQVWHLLKAILLRTIWYSSWDLGGGGSKWFNLLWRSFLVFWVMWPH